MDATSVHRHQSAWWQDICKIFYKEVLGNWLDCRCHWVLGNEHCVKFWEHRWVGGQVLKEKFPRLFMISQCTDSEVSDLVQRGSLTSEGCSSWSLTWRQERFIWEKHEEEKLLALISKVQWSKDNQDKLAWVGDSDVKQAYTVKSLYSVLFMDDQMQTSKEFELLWILKIALSALVCAWRVLVDILLTRYN